MRNMEKVTAGSTRARARSASLVNDPTIAHNVEEITEDARGFVGSITKLQTIVGLRTEYNVFGERAKNYISVELQPRPDKFYLIELVEDPRGYYPRRVTDRRADHGNSDRTTVTRRKSCASRSSSASGSAGSTRRYGIKESTGGDRRRPATCSMTGFALGRRVRRQGQTVSAHHGDDRRTRSGSGTSFLIGGRRRPGQLRALARRRWAASTGSRAGARLQRRGLAIAAAVRRRLLGRGPLSKR